MATRFSFIAIWTRSVGMTAAGPRKSGGGKRSSNERGVLMSNWFPENVSTFGGDVDGIFWFIFYITAVWFFLTEGLIVYFIIRYRRKLDRRAAYVSGDSLNQLAWVFVPVAIPSDRHNCSLQPIQQKYPTTRFCRERSRSEVDLPVLILDWFGIIRSKGWSRPCKSCGSNNTE